MQKPGDGTCITFVESAKMTQHTTLMTPQYIHLVPRSHAQWIVVHVDKTICTSTCTKSRTIHSNEQQQWPKIPLESTGCFRDWRDKMTAQHYSKEMYKTTEL